jgi:hypothetical protein
MFMVWGSGIEVSSGFGVQGLHDLGFEVQGLHVHCLGFWD